MSSSNQSSSSSLTGNNGDRLYDVTHEDIDHSTIDVACDSGSAEVTLREAIWWSWVQRRTWNLGKDGRANEGVDVDSDWWDGDHNLVVIAKANGTSVRVRFESS
jgi:hypothetical protein